MSMKLVLASNNAGKLAELQELFAPLGIALVRQSELNVSEADEPHAPWEQGREAPTRQELDLGADLLARRPVHGMRDRIGQPVEEGEPRVDLDRETSVGRRDEDATADADGLGDERPLPVAVAQLIFCAAGRPVAPVALLTDTLPAALNCSPSMPISEAPCSETSSPR